MTVKDWHIEAVKKLNSASVPTARLDAEILLADELSKDRSWIHANSESEIKAQSLDILNRQINRRSEHEPIAYIRGRQEFYGRDFKVSPDTLTPRPETETLVELALDIINSENIKSVADIGTGSGCIIITLQLELSKDYSFTGYDVSDKALVIAKENAKDLGTHVTFKRCDITKSAQGWKDADLIVANLPYVPGDFHINLAASHEPPFAIFGGKDGLDYYRKLFEQLNKPQFVITESMPPQHKELEKIAHRASYKLQKTQDFIQLFSKL